jgi:hypothetical protein
VRESGWNSSPLAVRFPTAYHDANPDWKNDGGEAAALSALFKRDEVMSVSAVA